MDSKKLLAALKKEISKKIRVQKVYLFGSRARGTFHAESDYDIAVISPDFYGLSFLERQQLLRPLIRKVLGNVSIDVACYTKEEYLSGKKGFLPQIIEAEGIPA